MITYYLSGWMLRLYVRVFGFKWFWFSLFSNFDTEQLSNDLETWLEEVPE